MISTVTKIKDLITKYDLESTMTVNSYLKKNPSLVQEMKDGQHIGSCYSTYLDLKKLFNRNEFTWEKEKSHVYKLRTLTTMKGLTTKENESYIPWCLTNASYYQEAFPLHLIQDYVSRPNYMFGTQIYDQSLRLQCDLLQIFLVFHLKHDFRFNCKISGGKYSLMDPLTRMKIRENLKNSEIYNKYFNDTFNLKEFVFMLYDCYFPNVTWRYIGAGHFAHRITIQITEFLYQIGLWSYEDNERLMKIILEKSENLLTLEKACKKDLSTKNFSNSFKKELVHLFIDTKDYLSLIILHSIVLVNDESLKESLSWKRESKGVFMNSSERPWENVYHKDRELNNLLNTIVMKYLLNPHVSSWNETIIKKEKEAGYVYNETKKRIDDFFMIMSDKDNDIFSKGNELVTEDLLAFHLKKFPKVKNKKRQEIRKQAEKPKNDQWDPPVPIERAESAKLNNVVKKPERTLSNNFIEEALEIRLNLISLIDDITGCEFGEFENLTKDTRVEKVVSHMVEWISSYLKRSREMDGKLYFRQLALGEQNVPVLLLTIISILNSLEKDSTIKLVIKSLTEVCKDNITTQAQLFFDQGFEHFKELNVENPLLGAIMTTDIFMNNNKMLYLNQETFKSILRSYRTKVRFANKIFKIEEVKQDPKKYFGTILALEKFNTYFQNFISVENLKTEDIGHFYDLVLQKSISKVMSDQILPILATDYFLSTVNKTNFRLPMMHSKMSLNQIMELIELPRYSDEILRGYIFDLCVSFLKLFNKCTSRLIYGKTYEYMTNFVNSYDLSGYDYLFELKDGIAIRTEILKLFSNFNCFYNNHLITDRYRFNDNSSVLYLEHFIPLGNDSQIIEIEFDTLEKVRQAKIGRSSAADQSVRDYMLEGLLPMIYKFCKGVSTTYFINPKLGNIQYLSGHKDSINIIFDVVKDNVKLIIELLDARFDPKIEENFRKLTTVLEGQGKAEDLSPLLLDKPPVSRKSQYRDVETDKIQFKGKDYGDMDFDEIIYPSLYEMRKKAEFILHFIEQIYPKGKRAPIEKISRVSANKRKGFSNERSIPLEKLNQYYAVRNPQTEEMEKNKKVKASFREMKEFIAAKNLYYTEKQYFLELSGQQNVIFSFFGDNPEQVGNVLYFITSSIFNVFKAGEVKEEDKDEDDYDDWSSDEFNNDDDEDEPIEDIEQIKKDKEKKENDFEKIQTKTIRKSVDKGFIVTKFFESKHVYAYIKYLDYLISEYEEMKWAFFYMVSTDVKKSSMNIFEKGKGYFKNRKLSPLDKSNARKILSIIYYLFTELGQFCAFKSFQDEDWGIIWDIYYRIGGVIKNLCEDNSIYFKRFFSDFVPQIESNTKFNSSGRNIAFDCYVRMESINNANLSWYIKDSRLMIGDRPEMLIMSLRFFEIVSEFMNGPCPYNQRLLYKYRTDTWMGLVMRVIDDVDSVFYAVKAKSLDFILSMIEGEGVSPLDKEVVDKQTDWALPFLVSKYIVANLTASSILDLVYKMLKKLMMARLFNTRKGFWDQIRKKVDRNRQRQRKIDTKAKIKTPKDIEEDLLKKKASDRMFSQFDNKLSIVTQEMMDCYQIDHYDQIMDLYKSDPEFSGHRIIEICIKLYSMLETLSRQSRNLKLFLRNKKLKLSKFYGENVDIDDRAFKGTLLDQVLKNSSIKVASRLEESMVFFMFVLKISKKIEIATKQANSGTQVTKIVYFPLMPSTFFLEEKTKIDIFKEIDVDNRRQDFQKRFKMFFLEMEQNYQFSIESKFLHWVCRNESFYYQKLFCYGVGVALNILIVWFYKLTEAENGDLDGRDLTADQMPLWIIRGVGIGFSAYTFLLVFFWLISRAWRQYTMRREQFVMENPLDDPETYQNKMYIFFVMTIFGDSAVLNFFLHFIFAITGTILSPFFNTLHLLLLVNISRTALYVLKASTAHFRQLLITLILSAFMIYSLSTFNAEFYSGAFDSEGLNNIDVCKTMARCILYTINLGLRNGGGIADNHTLYNLDDHTAFRVAVKTVFDLAFFFFINVILLNIVFGIIIDTFGEMRGEAEERDQKLSNTCLICLIEPSTFEENGVSFEDHILVEHNMWLYPFFIKYLQSKPTTEYNGDELEVWNKYKSGSDDWMPYKMTRYLNNFEIEQTDDKIENLEKKVQKMEGKIDIIGKNTLYIKEVVDKLASKNELAMEELDVDNMDFEIDSLDDLDLELDDLDLSDLDLD